MLATSQGNKLTYPQRAGSAPGDLNTSAQFFEYTK